MYLTAQDILEEVGADTLISLTDNDGSGALDEARLNRALEYGTSTVEAYLRTRYSLPVPATPLVKALCTDLAVFHLYKSRASVAEGVYKVKKDAHDEAIKLLKAIQRGEAALDVPAVSETLSHPATSDEVLTNKGRTVFGANVLVGF